MLPILTDKSWISWIYRWYIPQIDWYRFVNYHKHRGHLPYMVMWLCIQTKMVAMHCNWFHVTAKFRQSKPDHKDQLQPSTHIDCLWSSFRWVLGFSMVLVLNLWTLVQIDAGKGAEENRGTNEGKSGSKFCSQLDSMTRTRALIPCVGSNQEEESSRKGLELWQRWFLIKVYEAQST